jgi:hypothetical protein
MKRSFLLLEVLVGIALLTIAMSFLFDQPIWFLKKEKIQLEQMAIKQLFKQTLDETRLLFFKNEISLPFDQKNKTVYYLKPVKLNIEGLSRKKLERNLVFWIDPKKEKIGKLGQTFNLMHLQICFKGPKINQKQKTFLLVQKLSCSHEKK